MKIQLLANKKLQRKIENLEANNDDTNDDIESGEKNANLDDIRQQY